MLRRIIKWAGIGIFIILIFMSLSIILVPMLFKTDHIKHLLISTVKAKTGKDLVLIGPLKLVLYPMLNLEINEVNLVESNDKDQTKKTILSIEKGQLRFKLIDSLLANKLLSQLVLTGLDIDIEQFSAIFAKPYVDNSAIKSKQINNSANETFSLERSLKEVIIKNSTLRFKTKGSNESLIISQLELKLDTDNHQEKFPLNISGVVTSNNPFIISNFKLKGTGQFGLTAGKRIFKWYGNFNSPSTRFKNIILTKAFGKVNLKMVKPDDFTLAINQVTGKLTDNEFQTTMVLIKTAKNQSLMMHINCEGLEFPYSTKNYPFKIKGQAKLTMDLWSKANSHQSLVKQLQGKGKIIVTNGLLQGIDLQYWLKFGLNVLKHHSNTEKNTQQTKIGNLTTDFTLKDEILHTTNLQLDNREFIVTGNGSVDLNNDKVNFLLHLQPLNIVHKMLNDLKIPLRITGTVERLNFKLETQDIIQQTVKSKIKEKINKELGKNLGDISSKNILEQFGL